jgi:chemotaxis protein MotB
VKRGSHGGGGHGGSSWKVAYADFVTALMAFFLLLWLVSMTSPEKRARVSNYFKEYSLFEKSGDSILEYVDPPKVPIGDPYSAQGYGPEGEASLFEKAAAVREQFVENLRHEIESKLSEVKNQILIRVNEEGVRIEVVDLNGSPLFPLSSSEMEPAARKILAVIAQTLTQTNHYIAIEGHTDARVFATSAYSNWELSTERASAARIELEKAGLSSDRLLRVAGYASTEPLIREDPMDPRNRRISIMVYSPLPKAHS